MGTSDGLDRLDASADAMHDDRARAVEDHTDEELTEITACEWAAFFLLKRGYLVASPDDPEMARFLVEDEGLRPDFANLVLETMRVVADAKGIPR